MCRNRVVPPLGACRVGGVARLCIGVVTAESSSRPTHICNGNRAYYSRMCALRRLLGVWVCTTRCKIKSNKSSLCTRPMQPMHDIADAAMKQYRIPSRLRDVRISCVGFFAFTFSSLAQQIIDSIYAPRQIALVSGFFRVALHISMPQNTTTKQSHNAVPNTPSGRVRIRSTLRRTRWILYLVGSECGDARKAAAQSCADFNAQKWRNEKHGPNTKKN